MKIGIDVADRTKPNAKVHFYGVEFYDVDGKMCFSESDILADTESIQTKIFYNDVTLIKFTEMLKGVSKEVKRRTRYFVYSYIEYNEGDHRGTIFVRTIPFERNLLNIERECAGTHIARLKRVV